MKIFCDVGLIDSIDPDPLDPTVNQMPDEWHKTEFIQGLILSDISSSDPRHRNEDFEWGQDISQLACIGSARDLIAQAYNGKRGPELMVLAAGTIPAGSMAKVEMKALTKMTTIENSATRLTKLSRYTGFAGLYKNNELNIISTLDKEGAVPVILNKGGTEEGLKRVMQSEAAYKGGWDISYAKIADTLSVEGSTASWRSGELTKHYIKHRGDFAGLSTPIIYNTEQEYDTAARTLWSRNDATIERYCDVIDHNVGVLDSQTGAYVAIDSSGILRTYQVKEMNTLRKDTFRFIKIN